MFVARIYIHCTQFAIVVVVIMVVVTMCCSILIFLSGDESVGATKHGVAVAYACRCAIDQVGCRCQREGDQGGNQYCSPYCTHGRVLRSFSFLYHSVYNIDGGVFIRVGGYICYVKQR